MGSGSGLVGRTVAFDTRDVWMTFSQRLLHVTVLSATVYLLKFLLGIKNTWLWHCRQSGCFRLRRSTVWIQSPAQFYIEHLFFKWDIHALFFRLFANFFKQHFYRKSLQRDSSWIVRLRPCMLTTIPLPRPLH